MNHKTAEALTEVAHVALAVADIGQSVRWYTSSFACSVIIEQKTFALLQFANLKLALVLPSQEPPHLAFLREDALQFGELSRRNDGLLSTYLSDPTGNVVELVASSSALPSSSEEAATRD